MGAGPDLTFVSAPIRDPIPRGFHKVRGGYRYGAVTFNIQTRADQERSRLILGLRPAGIREGKHSCGLTRPWLSP